MRCNKCFWCRIGISTNKKYKCKLYPAERRFNHPKLHGFICTSFVEVNKETGEPISTIDNNIFHKIDTWFYKLFHKKK